MVAVTTSRDPTTDSIGGIRVENVDTCYICADKGILLYDGLKDHLFDIPGEWRMLRCPQCGLVWLSPRPAPEVIALIYQSYYTHVDRSNALARSLRESIRNHILSRHFGYPKVGKGGEFPWLGRFLSHMPFFKELESFEILNLPASWRGKLLDVGSGNGSFIAKMRGLGWDVQGLEIDENAASFARKTFDLPITVGTLEDANFPEHAFDVVTLSHVVEHLYDPMGVLRECRRILAPGGRVVVVTPNLDSLLHNRFKKAWRGLETPRHFMLFTSSTLERCGVQAGFETEGIRSTARAARHFYRASRMIRQDRTSIGTEVSRGWRLALESYAFQGIEEIIRRFVTTTGEEILYLGRKPID